MAELAKDEGDQNSVAEVRMSVDQKVKQSLEWLGFDDWVDDAKNNAFKISQAEGDRFHMISLTRGV